MFNNFIQLTGFIFIIISIVLRLILLILNVNVPELNFIGVIIPYDFSLFIFGLIVFLLYSKVPRKNIIEYLKIYERFRKSK